MDRAPGNGLEMLWSPTKHSDLQQAKVYVTWSCHKEFQIAHQEGHVHSTRGGKNQSSQ